MLPHIVLKLEYLLDSADVIFTLGSERDRIRSPVKNGDAVAVFDLFDHAAERGLGHEQLFGGPGEAFFFIHGVYIAHSFEHIRQTPSNFVQRGDELAGRLYSKYSMSLCVYQTARD